MKIGIAAIQQALNQKFAMKRKYQEGDYLYTDIPRFGQMVVEVVNIEGENYNVRTIHSVSSDPDDYYKMLVCEEDLVPIEFNAHLLNAGLYHQENPIGQIRYVEKDGCFVTICCLDDGRFFGVISKPRIYCTRQFTYVHELQHICDFGDCKLHLLLSELK